MFATATFVRSQFSPKKKTTAEKMEVEDGDGGSDERWTYAWTLVNLAPIKVFKSPEPRIPKHRN
jgi:hypothetical protein